MFHVADDAQVRDEHSSMVVVTVAGGLSLPVIPSIWNRCHACADVSMDAGVTACFRVPLDIPTAAA